MAASLGVLLCNVVFFATHELVYQGSMDQVTGKLMTAGKKEYDSFLANQNFLNLNFLTFVN